MDPTRLRGLLERVRAGDASIDDALSELKDLPFTDLGYAVVDHHRGLRQGVPEVILAQSKTPQQVRASRPSWRAPGRTCSSRASRRTPRRT